MKARSSVLLAAILPPCLLLLSACDLSNVIHVADSNEIARDGVQISQEDGKLRVLINGELFTEYRYTGLPRPCFYPVLGPDELPMTRHWPMETSPDEKDEHDHTHHRGLWYAHSNVDGIDFWNEKGTGRIVHDKFLAIESGKKTGMIKSTDKWVEPDGTIACTDIRTVRFYNQPDDERLLDFDITLQAPPDRPVVFGDDKDGTIAIRVAESMRLTHGKNPGNGHIVLSTGLRDQDTWGKRADWCDYYGPINGKNVGIAIFDHPSNFRHPTWWHVRDYGLFAANTFGISYFENKPKGTGAYTLPAGQSMTFRYRFYMHEGNEQDAEVAAEYDKYAHMKNP
jgi:hypothetical protein